MNFISKMIITSATILVAATATAAPTHVQAPFPVGEVWKANTHPGHKPHGKSVDFNFGTDNQDFGKDVQAGAPGKVIISKFNTSYGNYVVIDIGGGWTLYYCHLKDRLVNVGDLVSATTKVGTVGSTGTSTGPHLHYEQRYNGYVQSATFNGEHLTYVNAPSFVSITSKNAPSSLPDGLYRASNESTVFSVNGGVRRAVPSAACFNDWFPNSWQKIQVVDPSSMYQRSRFDLPIAHLVRFWADPTVYWIVESFNGPGVWTPGGNFVARPLTGAAFDGMRFRWSDVKVLQQPVPNLYPVGATVVSPEPSLYVIDGAYARFANQEFTSGYRLYNSSTNSSTPFDSTVRLVHQNSSGSEYGLFRDFPWSRCGGLNSATTEGWSPAWTNIPNSQLQPRGIYNLKVIVSYWASGRNIQQRASHAGKYPLPDSESRLGAN